MYQSLRYDSVKLPTIIVIHGGGWRSGRKEAFAPMAAASVIRRFATVCIEYRLSNESLYAAAEYGFDALLIGTHGGSAGAHLSMLAGLTSKADSLNPAGTAEDYKIQAAVGLATPIDFPKRSDTENIAQWLGTT